MLDVFIYGRSSCRLKSPVALSGKNFCLLKSPVAPEELKKDQPLPKANKLLPFRPIWDKDHSVVRVGGRISNSRLSYSQSHPVIIDGKHPITKLIIRSEHLRLMHAGP